MGRVGGGAQMFGFGEGAAVELVDADVVAGRVDELAELGFELKSARGIADDFEDGFLHAEAVAFAGFGDR
jgi:hypothetical protein